MHEVPRHIWDTFFQKITSLRIGVVFVFALGLSIVVVFSSYAQLMDTIRIASQVSDIPLSLVSPESDKTTVAHPSEPAAPTPTQESTPTPTAEPTPTTAFIPTPSPTTAVVVQPTATQSVVPTATPTTAVVSNLSFTLGANLPWFNWSCDFGCGSSGGVQDSSVKNALAQTFAQAHASGITQVRWWMFPDDPWQITRDSAGKPTGIDQEVYADIDAALALAKTYNIKYTFVFFSAPSHIPQSWLSNSTHQKALASVLGILTKHYATNANIVTWEIINEPEWDTWYNGYSESQVVSLVNTLATEIHKQTNKKVSVGSAMADAIPIWQDQQVDFLDIHWYDYMGSGEWCVLCTNAAAMQKMYGTSKDIFIGEYYGGDTVSATKERLDQLYGKGYNGAFGWSLLPDHTTDGMEIKLSGVAQFVAEH